MAATVHAAPAPVRAGMPARTLGLALALVLFPALGACGSSGGGDRAAGATSAAATGTGEGSDDGSGGGDAGSGAASEVGPSDLGAGSESGSGSGAASDLERSRDDTSTDLERRVSETLSELDAEMRGGDTVVTLPERVLFDYDQHTLRPDAAPVLDGLVEVIAYFADAPVQVNGHTDANGSSAYNQDLSERRAQAVVDHLAGAGVDPGRLTARGFGETQPVAPNTHPDGSDNPEGRAQNRRVEIVIEGADLTQLPE